MSLNNLDQPTSQPPRCVKTTPTFTPLPLHRRPQHQVSSSCGPWREELEWLGGHKDFVIPSPHSQPPLFDFRSDRPFDGTAAFFGPGRRRGLCHGRPIRDAALWVAETVTIGHQDIWLTCRREFAAVLAFGHSQGECRRCGLSRNIKR
jgi:hypothetical protein